MIKHFLSLILMIVTSATLLSAPNLEWDRTEIYIEMAPEEEEALAVFNVTNRGKQAVRISKIETSCGCTGSIIDKKIIQPGKSTKITGRFNKGKRQGLNRNKLEVFLDNESESVATLIMSVDIPNLIEATPQFVYWSKESPTTERRVQIKMDERFIDEISSIKYDRESLRVIQQPGSSSSENTLALVIEPLSYETFYRGSIGIIGQGEEGYTHETQIHVFVQP